jgi:hypothetical protein
VPDHLRTAGNARGIKVPEPDLNKHEQHHAAEHDGYDGIFHEDN